MSDRELVLCIVVSLAALVLAGFALRRELRIYRRATRRATVRR
jgi:hypothetical protein